LVKIKVAPTRPVLGTLSASMTQPEMDPVKDVWARIDGIVIQTCNKAITTADKPLRDAISILYDPLILKLL
jgi:hypothetical protein